MHFERSSSDVTIAQRNGARSDEYCAAFDIVRRANPVRPSWPFDEESLRSIRSGLSAAASGNSTHKAALRASKAPKTNIFGTNRTNTRSSGQSGCSGRDRISVPTLPGVESHHTIVADAGSCQTRPRFRVQNPDKSCVSAGSPSRPIGTAAPFPIQSLIRTTMWNLKFRF